MSEVKGESTQEHTTRALLVDDDPQTLNALCMVLRRAGYHVVCAESGEVALASARRWSFDVAICDRHMPGMDGIELLERLRELQPMCQRLLLTGGLDLDTAVEAVNRGAINRVLQKPVERSSLLAGIRDALQERHRMRQAYQDLQDKTSSIEREMVADLLAGDYIQLAMQPIMRAGDRGVFGYEALLRSSHADLDSPASVLAAVERHGMVDRLAEVVALAAVNWLHQAPTDLTLFLNLHPAELAHPAALRARLERLRPHASRVVLEITERSSIYGVGPWQDSVEMIRELGFEIAVDDLGAGYSALAVLAELQPRYIKVDMSIVRDADRQTHKQRLLDLLCRFADATGSLLVAEGIETEAEANTVCECGAHLLQGYYFGRPRLPASLRLVGGTEANDGLFADTDVA